MKRVWRSWTFWFVAVAIVGIILNLTGIDDLNLYIGLNLILFKLGSVKQCRDWINSIPGLWYMLSLATMTLYGLILDFVKYMKKD